MLTQAVLKENLNYNSETGVFTWLKQSSKKTLGKPAGTVNGKGYLYITLNRKMYRAHRIAWLYVHGCFPDGMLDHRDGVRINNAIDNLRIATGSQNCMNKKMQSNNTSGFIGVTKARKGEWRADASFNKKVHYLGSFPTPEEASLVYQKFAQSNRGNFHYPQSQSQEVEK